MWLFAFLGSITLDKEVGAVFAAYPSVPIRHIHADAALHGSIPRTHNMKIRYEGRTV